MKHKLLFGIAAAALAATMCIGFVGCGGSAKSIKGEEVSREEWTAAFKDDTFANYKLVITGSSEAKTEGKTGKQTSKATVTVADKKEHLVLSSSAEGDAFSEKELEQANKEEEYYVDGTSLVPVIYGKNDDGKWAKVTSGTTASTLVGVVKTLALLYDAFEYNTEKNGYVLKTGQSVAASLEGAVVKFKDGKLAGLYMEMSEEEEDGDYYKIVQDYYFTYGGESVKLPEVE